MKADLKTRDEVGDTETATANLTEDEAGDIHPIDVAEYERIGVMTPEEMRQLESNGIYSSDAVNYYEAGFTTLQEMLDLKAADVYSNWAAEYARAGARTIEAAVKLADAGVQGVDAETFRKCGITTAAEMTEYTKAGLRGLYARGFIDYGIISVDEIERHIGSGICPREVLFYLLRKGDEHNFDFGEVITLVAGGIRSTKVEDYINAGVTDPEHIVNIKQASKTNGVTTDDLPELFKTLDNLGELGTRIAAAHPAAKTTINAIKETPELAAELDTLNNDGLKIVIALAEEHEQISKEELRATIKAVTL